MKNLKLGKRAFECMRAVFARFLLQMHIWIPEFSFEIFGGKGGMEGIIFFRNLEFK